MYEERCQRVVISDIEAAVFNIAAILQPAIASCFFVKFLTFS